MKVFLAGHKGLVGSAFKQYLSSAKNIIIEIKKMNR